MSFEPSPSSFSRAPDASPTESSHAHARARGTQRAVRENPASIRRAERECDRIAIESRNGLQADDAREAAGLPRKRQKAELGDAEPAYRRWSTAKWNKLETEEQKRRTIEVPREGPANPKKAKLPPGDDSRHAVAGTGIGGAASLAHCRAGLLATAARSCT